MAASTTPAGETLEEAWRHALEANPSLRAAERHVESARRRLDAAEAERLPRLWVGASWTRLDEAPSTVLRLPIPGGPAAPMTVIPLAIAADEDLPIASGQLSVPVWTSGRISAAIAATSEQADVRELGRRASVQDLKLAVADAYLQVLRSERDLAVAADAVSSLEAHARIARDLHEEGVIARHDLLAAEVSLADARQGRIAAASGLEVARAAYNRRLARDQGSPVLLRDLPAPSLRLGDPRQGDGLLAELVARARDGRAELAALRRRAAAVRSKARSLSAEGCPQVSATGAYTWVENDVLDQDAFWSATVAVSWEVLDGGRTADRARALELEAEALELQRESLADGIALETRTAWRRLTAALERLEATRESVALAEENLEVARDRFANGVGTGAEVLDARARLTRARSSRDDARYDAVQADLELQRAVGAL